jgi:uncharacterized protein YxjI
MMRVDKRREASVKPRLKIKQKLTAYVNRYSILALNEDGSDGALVGLAQQKRFALREKVLFYSGDNREKVSFSFRAEKIFDVHGNYLVEDANGNQLGVFKKSFAASLINSTWQILDKNNNVVFTIKESNQALAIFRRFAGQLPFIGDIAELIVLFFKYHFVMLDTNGATVGKYEKITLFRDHYILSTTDEAWASLDSRVFYSVGVALDALQSR